MRISPTSAAGQRLQGFGVTEIELARARFFRWNAQTGGAITIALPLGRAVILMKSRYLPTDDRGELSDGRHLALARHELCHVAQMQHWGFLGYWARHLWARVSTRSILAPESDAERPCYQAQARAAAEYED